MTTHVGLTARAFGADSFFIPNEDKKIFKTLKDVTERFGGDFEVKEKKDWKELVKTWSGTVIHLTMYGQSIDTFFSKNEDLEDPLIIVGAEKVPKDVYDIADHNVAVGSEPHSEVAALAVFLDRYNGRELPKLRKGDISVLASERDKRVIDNSKIPNAETCFKFAKENGMDEGLLQHTMSVLQRTLELHEKHGGDLQLLIAGALLHDIGRTRSHGVDHGVLGGDMIRDEGWEEELARIVECHVGGGLTREEAEELDIPTKDYLPETVEEKIVCHADNTAGGEERFQGLIQRVEEDGNQKSAARMRRLAEEFEDDL